MIEVKLIENKLTGVYLDGMLVAQSKHSFDCDHFAERLAKFLRQTVIGEVVVNHNARVKQAM